MWGEKGTTRKLEAWLHSQSTHAITPHRTAHRHTGAPHLRRTERWDFAVGCQGGSGEEVGKGGGERERNNGGRGGD